jgi:hypothetical protein
LSTVALDEIGEQRFVRSGQRVRERTAKGVTISQIDTVLIAQENKIPPGAMVAFGKLMNELTDAGCLLGDNQVSFAPPNRDWFSQLAF